MEQNNILLRRQTEINLLLPVIHNLSVQFCAEEVINNIRNTIESLAFEDGKKLKKENEGKNNFLVLGKQWEKLASNNSLIIEDFLLSGSSLSFRITRCKYAEYYKGLNAESLGEVISCCRDEAFLKGFSNKIKMSRSKTILEGNDSCIFNYK
ncbi:MAG: L-2-amino-thiazoline-4-carboxylic acid hydrolase [Draconibacterium sp.]|nr:L-2-amino-thiazoline-4-carboxylic acid hydrolase [Draconibacterium sp.]